MLAADTLHADQRFSKRCLSALRTDIQENSLDDDWCLYSLWGPNFTGFPAPIEGLTGCGNLDLVEPSPKERVMRVQSVQLQPGNPAYITVTAHDGIDDLTHLTSTSSKQSTFEPVAKWKKANRPCKGQRKRLKKFVEHLKMQILADPESFDVQNVNLLPSLSSNAEKRQRLMDFIEEYHQRVKSGDVVDALCTATHGVEVASST